jgi:murein DD-endopeptidase MepM/ murein hydrolase activator NlpD
VNVPNVRCCPTKQIVDIGLDGEKWRLIPGPVVTSQSLCETTKNLVFPLAPGSLQHISVNFGGNRENGKRCHAGIDLFTRNAKKVVAMADGVVTNVIDNFIVCSCTGKPVQAGAVLIYHPSIGQTVNYGEMSTSSIAVAKGATVSQGTFLGTADACCLLHIEMYNGSHSAPLHWLPDTANKKSAYDPDGCTHNSMKVKPAALLDPRPVINCIKPAGVTT